MSRFARAFAPFFLFLALRAAVPEFEPNTGQAEQRHLFLARAGATRAYVEDRGLELATSSGAAVRLSWKDGAAANGQSRGVWAISESTGNTTYYCVQNKSSLCTEGVRSYRRLLRKDLYPGIDWDLHGRGGKLEYDLVVHPGARLRDVRLRVDGAPAEVGVDGRLRAGGMLHWRPEAYQMIDGKRVEVDAALRASGDAEFEFVTGGYDAAYDLVIDPVVEAIAVAGGSDEDAILGSGSSNSCSYQYGTTRSADWHRLPAAGGHHVFVQFNRSGYGVTTYFWGGEGEESIGGVDADLNNCRLFVVGWTNSRNAPILSTTYENPVPQPYAGGATDGFLLQFWGGLAFASYVGGPGADRLHDVRTTAMSGYPGPLAFAGETDDTAWVGATVRTFGAGGKTEAIAGLLNRTRISMVAIGGAGNDRAMRLRSAGQGFWAIAGETDSPDFPVREGASDSVQPAAGNDLWVGRLPLDLSELSVLRVFGGSGDERFGGLGVLAAQGLYLAGTTTSPDLPAASGAYHGGDSDGFVAHLDPLTAVPQVTTYIGGAGRDEILATEARDGDVFLGGTTDSNSLPLPGLAAGEDVHGGLDALLVLCDALGEPTRGIRVGGSADDRVLGIEPRGLGKVTLAGSSDSRDWLNELDPFHAESSGLDGFLANLSFAALRISGFSDATPGKVYLGRDLQVPMAVSAASEAGMDGIVLVRSSDPSRLLVSAGRDLPGSGQILLEDTDRADSYSYGKGFMLQALADSGEVELIVEGRAAASPKGAYPRQRIRVSLAPAALFLSSPKSVSVPVNGTVDVAFFQAPLLPDGRSGSVQGLRAGVTSTPGLLTSDATGLQVLRDSIAGTGDTGSYRAQALALRDGAYTLTPSSSQFPAGPGQSLAVRVSHSPAPVSLFSDRPHILAKDHFTTFPIGGLAGDELRFTSEDPSRLVLGADNTASAGALSLTLQGNYPSANLVIAALASDGTAKVRVEGTHRGRPISEALLVNLAPYKAELNGVPERIGSGARIYPQIGLLPQTALPGVVEPVVPYMYPRPAAFANAHLRSSNPSVLQVAIHASEVLTFGALAGAPGDAVLDFGSNTPPELAGLSASVRVVPAHLEFGVKVLRIPPGGDMSIYPAAGTNAGIDTLKAVRLRLSAAAPLTLRYIGQVGTDFTANFSTGSAVQLSADTARVGQQATLFVSAPSVPEYALPIRIVEAVLLPYTSDLQVAPVDGKPATGNAAFRLGVYDEGPMTLSELSRLTLSTPVKVRPRTNPPGICETPDTVETAGFGGLYVPVTCSATGTTVLELQPITGLTTAQPQFTMRIVSRPGAPVPLPVPRRVMTGNGLQAQLNLSDASGSFSGAITITSNDPSRVRLSLDAKAPGAARITTPASSFSGVIYVQGFAAEGAATLTVEAADGRKADITVLLFPSTVALRPATSNHVSETGPVLSMDHPVSSKDFTLAMWPGLVDPDTGKLFWSSALSIRGGTDPAFVRSRSSDPSIVEPAPPDALLSEGDATARLNFRAKATGDVVLSASQPEGFVEATESSLRVRVYERQLVFSVPPVLSADLQMPVSVVALGGDTQSSVNVTLTSLAPDKLRISSDGAATGEASITAPLAKPVYLQALSAAAPGDTVRVRLEAPGYVSGEREVQFVGAELQMMYPESSLSLRPLVSSVLSLRYGPVDERGRVSNQFSGSFRPGIRLPVRISSSDSSVVSISQSEMTLAANMNIPLLPLAPGRAQIRIEASPQITNRVPTLDAVVGLFQFNQVYLGTPVGYLVTNFTISNPRPQPTTITLSSVDGIPLRIGTAATGPDAPAASSLSVTLAPSQSRLLFVEPAGSGFASIRIEAPDFAPASSGTHATVAQVRFDSGNRLNVSLANRTSQVAILLADPNRSSVDLPLGTAFGPLKIQLESSNPQVVRVPAAPVEFAPGDSRKNAVLELVGRGDAVVSLIVPAGFAGASSVRQDLLVSVQ